MALNEALLKRLLETPAVSGREERLRAIVRDELGALADEVRADALGNVIAVKRGRDDVRVMVTAHLDEIGFYVKHIDDRGFLRLEPVGWIDPANLISQRVLVTTASGAVLRGALQPIWQPVPLTRLDERKVPQMGDFYVDVGLTGDAARKVVRLGDPVAMDRTFERVGDHYMGKAMDDRVVVFVMLEALRALRSHEATIYAVATAQEEVGARGAAASAAALGPTAMIALDIVNARDVPGTAAENVLTTLGGGVALKVMDALAISNPRLVEHVRRIAERDGIPYQVELKTVGGTDVGGVQRLHGGIPAMALSVPTRYVHTVNEMVHPADVQACIDLLARYLGEAHTEEYTL